MLSVEDWAEIRRLHRAEKLPISEIARVLGVSRNTVRAALASDAPPKYERKPAGSIVDAVEPRIRELLQAYPTMPATVIAERIGWTRSIRVLSARVAELRPAYLPPDPAGRTSYEAGEIAQCDLWFPPITLPVGFGQARKPTQLPVLTMVTGYSRWLSAVLIPTRVGGGPVRRLVAADRAARRGAAGAGLGRRGRDRPLARRARSSSPPSARRSAARWARRCSCCKPRDPEAKGMIERAHDYLERSFLPGRTFTGPADFNTQLQQWLHAGQHPAAAGVGLRADRPDHRRPAGDARPAAGRAGDRVAVLAAAARDHYVRLDSNDYSVHPRVIGRRIEVIADLHRVRALCDGRLVADHERIWAWHQTISDPEHVAAAKALRRERVGVLRPVPEPDVQIRCLADYDTALGLDGGVA